MLKIGVVGAGHLGKIHIRLLLELTDIFEFVGFYDVDLVNSQSVANQFNIKSFPSISELINEVDCLDIVTPTLSHYACAMDALRARKHIFIEKPLSETMEEAKKMVMLTNEAEVIVQVGHVERFNPAFQAALPYLKNPMFIETHRLAQFNPRGTDVPVVLDLMIHDIDIILSVVKSRVKNIAASGVSVVSESHDITNARLEFENGCVANLTASRISLKNMRKSRFFQKDTYISVDFLTKELEVVSIEDIQGEPDPFDIILEIGKENKRKKILIDKPELAEVNAIKEELIAFHDAIVNKKHPIVSVEDGFSAMEVAYGILSKLEKSPIHF
jgi:predicted dehydrogenase